ncbi:SAM-dependent methyltransferase [Embleya sp. NBC_00896]|uniref:SAM-dependent methyltransferase n=1 Tax=Embleya sp. NBC_00896 TaxID=2975961 RepID=UPI00386F4BEA|nr:SAM-dependent methyltransferase [Embleya sp. NBC_00896]
MADDSPRGGFRGSGSLEIDFDRAHPARMNDYYLGGSTNFDVDRDAAERALASVPTLRTAARENRAFLLRAVEHLARSGVRQFVDIGTGIPIDGRNTHDVAQRVDPSARVVYVDDDPIVLAHAGALLTSGPQGRTAYIDANVGDPVAILAHSGFVDTVRPDEPVAVLLAAFPHFVADGQDPAALVAAFAGRLPSGSRLLISHVTADFDPAGWAGVVDAYARAGITVRPRTREQVRALLSGWEIEDPGVRVVSEWLPDPGLASVDAAAVSTYGAIARTR